MPTSDAPPAKSVRQAPPAKHSEKVQRDAEYAEAFRFDRDELNIVLPTRRKRKLSSNLPWILVAVGGGLLLVVASVVAFAWRDSKPADAKQIAQNPPGDNATSPKEAPDPQQDPNSLKEETKPKEEPSPPPAKQAEVPPGPTPPSIDVAATRRVKKATTYLKVTMGNGQVAEGSGFFAAEPGLVFTNAHVLGMLGSVSGLPIKVDVVVNSGEPEEFTRAGRVLGVDRTNDLGVIRVSGTQEGLPDPLPLDTTRNLAELQKVYIFGFPFGSSLGRNITVSESSVSSLRKDPDGTVHQVQVNGGMNPGNSGGPVVDARGVVIGVAVAIIRGTQINFAVPGEKVQGLLRGRVSDIEFGEPYLEGSQARLPIQVSCLDPLARLRDLKIEVWTGAWGPARPTALQQPAPQSGDGPRQTIPLVYRNGQAAAQISMPFLNKTKVLWIQPVLIDGGGVTHWAAATVYKASDNPPLERKAVTIQQQFDSQAGGFLAQRTVKWTGSYQLQMSKGPKQFSFGEALEVQAVEIVQKAPKGGQFNLFLVNSKLSSQVGDNKSAQNLKVLDMLRGRYFTFTTDTAGSLLERSFPAPTPAMPPGVRLEFAEMVNLISHTYEMTCLSLPNREVKPKETWQAVLPLILIGEGKHEVVDMVLTCSYEGSRLLKGQTQAMIALAGNLRSRQPGQNIGGKVAGKVHFAVDGSYLSEAKLKVESEAGAGDENATQVVEVTLTRDPSNTLGVVPTPPPPILVKGKPVLNEQAMLAPTDPTNHPERPGVPYKLYSVTLNAGTTYIIEMNKTSTDGTLDPYLVLRNPQGQMVAEDDDSGGNLNARIVYQATQTGIYQVRATAFQGGQAGPFRIIVSEASTFDPKTKS